MKWYAARSVYLFGITDAGKNIFEERIVCIKASSFEEAHKKAKKESEDYQEVNKFSSHSEQLIYEQDGTELVDGYELWSELYEADKDLDSFYKERYQNYLYIAD